MSFVRCLIFVLALSSLSFGGVSISSPGSGVASGSPVHFVASASRNTTDDSRPVQRFISVTMKGTKSYINKAFWPISVNASELNVAFQMNWNFYNAAYSTWVTS